MVVFGGRDHREPEYKEKSIMAFAENPLTRKLHFLQVGQECAMLLQLNILKFQTEDCMLVPWFQEETLVDVIRTLHGVVISRVQSNFLHLGKAENKKRGCDTGLDVVTGDQVRIAYTFRPQRVKNTILVRDKSLKLSKNVPVLSTKFSGGGYKHLPLFPEKIIATVCPIEITNLQALSVLTPAKRTPDVSHYFRKFSKNVTHSEERKKGNLRKIVRKMNRKRSDKKEPVSFEKGHRTILHYSTNEKPLLQTEASCGGNAIVSDSGKLLTEKSKVEVKHTNTEDIKSKRTMHDKRLPFEKNVVVESSLHNSISLHSEVFVDGPISAQKVDRANTDAENEHLLVTSNHYGRFVDLHSKNTTEEDPVMLDNPRYKCANKTSDDSCDGAQTSQSPSMSPVYETQKRNEALHNHKFISLDDYGHVDLSKVRSVKELSAADIKNITRNMERDIRDIFEGKVTCKRHQDYKNGGASRGELQYQVYTGPFSDEQQDSLMDALIEMFCYKHSRYLDYIMKVLFPEALKMVLSLVDKVPLEKADEILSRTSKSSRE